MPILGIGLDPWMAGAWQTSAPTAGDSPKDVNGVAITVGATVKLVGIVTAVNLSDPHFGDIQVTPLHPNGMPTVFQSNTGNPQSPNFQPGNPVLPVSTYGFQPLQLVVGS